MKITNKKQIKKTNKRDALAFSRGNKINTTEGMERNKQTKFTKPQSAQFVYATKSKGANKTTKNSKGRNGGLAMLERGMKGRKS